MYELIEYIVKALVTDKEAVTIEQIEDEKGYILNVNVAQKDLGQVIGKGGNVAESIRTIVKSYNPHKRVRIKFDAK